MFKIIILFSYIILMIGCSVNNSYINKNQNFSNQDTKLNEIFSDFMDRNDKYPYLYTYKQIRWRWLGNLQLKFENKIKKICKSEHGQILSMEEFLDKYGLIRAEFLDRCIGKYPNKKIAEEIFPYGEGTLPKLKLCVIDKKPIPKVLFAFGSDYRTYNGTRIREIVCIPDRNNWKYNFKHSHFIYQEKKKQEEKAKIKEEKIKKKKLKDIGIYEKLLINNKIIPNVVNLINPYRSKFKLSKNGKVYIILKSPIFIKHKICGTLSITDITPDLGLRKKYSDYPNNFGGKVEFRTLLCFNFYNRPKNIYFRRDKYYMFEIVPIRNKVIIFSSKREEKTCFNIKYDLFETENKTYCINGMCYPLDYFLKKLEFSFPKNKSFVIKLPNIECDLWKYYFSPNYVTKLLMIDPTLNEVKDIIYLENNYEINDGNDDLDIDEGY